MSQAGGGSSRRQTASSPGSRRIKWLRIGEHSGTPHLRHRQAVENLDPHNTFNGRVKPGEAHKTVLFFPRGKIRPPKKKRAALLPLFIHYAQ